MINPEGWIVTASHILANASNCAAQQLATQALDAQIAAIQSDATIGSGEKKRRLKTLGRPKPTDIDQVSVWSGRDGVNLVEGFGMAPEVADIGVGRLDPFDPTWVPAYPKFKDPKKDFEPGTSLCRMGFPFQEISVSFDESIGRFAFAPGAVPLPIFPIEGILTRMVNIVLAAGPGQPAAAPPWPLNMIETSSPGIPGQSGGPIFDTEGRIWGIQSSTTSFPLGLRTPEKQYLNVGLGVHPETIFGFLNDRKVKFEVAQD